MTSATTKICSKCGVEKALVEYNSDRKTKDGLRSQCKQCKSDYNRRRYQDNPESVRERSRRYYQANLERQREARHRHRAANRDVYRERARQWREDNPGYSQKQRKNNIARYREKDMARHAAKLQRTPAWADIDAIRSVYEEAQRLTEVFGIEHHVDHIEPLRGDTVCGLHVAENLQVIPAVDNLRKSNLAFEEYQFRRLI